MSHASFSSSYMEAFQIVVHYLLCNHRDDDYLHYKSYPVCMADTRMGMGANYPLGACRRMPPIVPCMFHSFRNAPVR